jgi:hypothetical protein
MGKTSKLKTSLFLRFALLAMLVMSILTIAPRLGAGMAEAAQATMTWVAPTTNTNGTTATNLAGFNVYIGSASGSYQQKINVGNVTSYTGTSFTSGSTYYFAVSAYNTSGLESARSNEVSKAFPAAPTTCTITATAGAGGKITALNNTSLSLATNGTSTITTLAVTSGANQSFTIAPSTGYMVQGVTVDGASVGALTSYTFSNVTANHTISATFAAATYTIAASAGTGGSISPNGSVAVTSGSSQSFSITPASGYYLAGVTVDGASVGAVSSYTFSSVAANHTIAASFAAVGSTTSSGGSVIFATNSAGPQYASSTTGVTYTADNKYSGGATNTTTATISGTPDGTLYQSERYGNFSYSIPVANGNYAITLKFAEIYYTASGKRVFNVVINGNTVISNLDICSKVGANTAYDVVVPVSVTTGAINVSFISVVDYAKISAIKIAPASPGTVVFATNSAAPPYLSSSTGTTYSADDKYSGGAINTTTASISGTSDPTLYQSERYGNFSYNIPVPNGNYAVTLKFDEIYYTAAGKRVFSVALNGQTVISNLDIYSKVGSNTAYDVELPVTVMNGAINLNFISQVDYAKIAAILVKTN